MNKGLHHLNQVYEALVQKPQFFSPYIEKTLAQRASIYNSFLSNITEEEENEIILENRNFTDLIGNILKNTKHNDRFYWFCVNLGVEAYKHSENLVSNTALEVIINNEADMFKSVLKDLKKHPHEAGFKISLINKAKKQINKTKEELFPEIEAENQNSSLSKNQLTETYTQPTDKQITNNTMPDAIDSTDNSDLISTVPNEDSMGE